MADLRLKQGESGPEIRDGHPVYVDDTGKEFVFDPTEVFSKLNALNKEAHLTRTELKRREDLAVRLRELGIDNPEEIARLKQEAEERAQREMESKGEYQRALDEQTKRFSKQFESAQAQWQAQVAEATKAAQERQAMLEGYVKRTEAIQAITALGGGEAVEALLPHVESRLMFHVDDSGKQQAVEAGPDGRPRVVDIRGTLRTAKDIVEEMREHKVFGRLFAGSGVAGSGSAQNGRQAPVPRNAISRADFDKLDPAAQMLYITKDGGKVVD